MAYISNMADGGISDASVPPAATTPAANSLRQPILSISGIAILANTAAVATDAHRLALSKSLLNEAASENSNGIIPRKSINEIGKLVGDESENIVIKLGPTSIAANVAGTTFVSKLIEGKFPDYEQVIPSGDSSLLVVDRKIFSDSLSRVSVLSSEKYKGCLLYTSPSPRD